MFYNYISVFRWGRAHYVLIPRFRNADNESVTVTMRPSAFHLIFPLTLAQQSLFDHYPFWQDTGGISPILLWKNAPRSYRAATQRLHLLSQRSAQSLLLMGTERGSRISSPPLTSNHLSNHDTLVMSSTSTFLLYSSHQKQESTSDYAPWFKNGSVSALAHCKHILFT